MTTATPESPPDPGWVLPDHLLTAQEVAGILRATSPRAVGRMRAAGKIPGIRVGRTWHYHRQDVTNYINNQRQGAHS